MEILEFPTVRLAISRRPSSAMSVVLRLLRKRETKLERERLVEISAWRIVRWEISRRPSITMNAI